MYIKMVYYYLMLSVTPSFNTSALIAGQTYSFVIKPLHGTVEFNSPASVSLTAYQPSSQVMNLTAQPKNNTIILSWRNGYIFY